jgi:hypothetical protein
LPRAAAESGKIALCYYTPGMCCPFFDPVEPRPGPARDSMLPLGGRWSGVCRANPEAPLPAVETAQRPLCNLGYARGECPRFPAGEAPDAVRFTVSRDNGAGLLLYYVVERNHLPRAHGPVEYSPALGAVVRGPRAGILTSQAGAYVRSYLRRKTEAGRGGPASNQTE